MTGGVIMQPLFSVNNVQAAKGHDMEAIAIRLQCQDSCRTSRLHAHVPFAPVKSPITTTPFAQEACTHCVVVMGLWTSNRSVMHACWRI